MPTSRGGYPLPVTPEGGYRYAGVPPIASGIMIASGQLSTDSFGADRSIGDRSGFGCSALFTKGSAWGDGLQRDGGGTGASVGSRRDSAMAVSSHRAPNKRHCEQRHQSRWVTWLERRAVASPPLRLCRAPLYNIPCTTVNCVPRQRTGAFADWRGVIDGGSTKSKGPLTKVDASLARCLTTPEGQLPKAIISPNEY